MSGLPPNQPLIFSQPDSGRMQRGEEEKNACVHDVLPYSVARKAISAFLSASLRSSPKRWPSFSISALHDE